MCLGEVGMTASLDLWLWLLTHLQMPLGFANKNNCLWELFKIKNQILWTGKKSVRNFMN